jgi:hypothetical protein
MKVLSAGFLIAVGLLILYVASRGGLDCISSAWTCLQGKTTGAGGGFSIPPAGTPGGSGGSGGKAG